VDDKLLRRLRYQPTRLPALDALEAHVPTGMEADPELRESVATFGLSRWYPVEDGHRVLVPYQGADFNERRFTLRKGAWDHEHCKRCGETIQPMTLCFVSTGDWEAILCEKCHEFVSATFVQRLLRKVGLPLILPRTTR